MQAWPDQKVIHVLHLNDLFLQDMRLWLLWVKIASKLLDKLLEFENGLAPGNAVGKVFHGANCFINVVARCALGADKDLVSVLQRVDKEMSNEVISVDNGAGRCKVLGEGKDEPF